VGSIPTLDTLAKSQGGGIIPNRINLEQLMQTATLLNEEEAKGNFLIYGERSIFHLMQVHELVVSGSLHTFKPVPNSCKRWVTESQTWEPTPCAPVTLGAPVIVRKKAGYALRTSREEAFLLLGGAEPLSPTDRGEITVAHATEGGNSEVSDM
jgi:hypothetical protein